MPSQKDGGNYNTKMGLDLKRDIKKEHFSEMFWCPQIFGYISVCVRIMSEFVQGFDKDGLDRVEEQIVSLIACATFAWDFLAEMSHLIDPKWC